MKKRWTKKIAMEELRLLKESGLSVHKFADRRGYSPDRLAWWKRRLRRDDNREKNATTANDISLLPVKVINQKQTLTSENRPLEVAFPNGLILRVGNDATPSMLHSAIEILMRQSC